MKQNWYLFIHFTASFLLTHSIHSFEYSPSLWLNKIINLQNYTDCGENCFESQLNGDLSFWLQQGNIDYESFQLALTHGIHYQIIQGNVYRQEKCSFPSRCVGIEHFLKRIANELPNIEFVLNVNDHPKVSKYSQPIPLFSFSKSNRELDILYPAWSFWAGGPAIQTEPTGLGRWDLKMEILRKTRLLMPWVDKLDVGFFRGSRTSSERDPLILLSREKPHLIQAAYTKNQAWKSSRDTLGVEPAEIVTFEDHCKYKYLFNFRGIAASFRFRHLFLCESLVLHIGEDWIEFFYSELIPWYHYIPVSTSLKEVEELLIFARDNDETVRVIAENGRRFIERNLRMEDITNYWRLLLLKYSKLISWNVVRDSSFIQIN